MSQRFPDISTFAAKLKKKKNCEIVRWKAIKLKYGKLHCILMDSEIQSVHET